MPGTEALEANPGLESDSGVTTCSSSSSPVAGDNATIPIPDNGDRIRALMAKYEQVMSGDGAKTQRASSADEGGRTTILPLSRDDNDRIDDKPTTSSTPRSRPSSRGTRGSRKGHSEAQSRVQKKRASVSGRYAYAFERLGGARRAARGSIECEVY
ncbi:hypothetical protein QQS21_006348 [Conoideocrella luteorostrata]|uniref:Uncharacterized protein n=1 Tax=Conoideocrella luteorostrata TaxID=1105319 RepID=A0AAJ0CMU3_9HYPO|nr:hypothetical protein QQS21_006348 [Conoideocrella luteorostrata]